MKLFIDTNILLDIYHLSGPDLQELRKLVDKVANGELEVLLPQQVVDEFWRNREGVIADALKRFRESGAKAAIPNVLRVYDEAAELRAAVAAVQETVKQLGDRVRADIEAGDLAADRVVKDLFAAAKPQAISENVVARSRLRVDIGNPPGKRGSMGDAINWEWLLDHDLDGETLAVLLTADGDYESELVQGRPKQFLLDEWRNKHPRCELRLEKSLTAFLEAYAPEIELVDEVKKETAIEDLEKLAAIEELEGAGAFRWVHRAIGRLRSFDDFTDAEVGRLLSAYLKNDQIYSILGDVDVLEFAQRLISLAKSDEALDLAGQLDAMVSARLGGEVF